MNIEKLIKRETYPIHNFIPSIEKPIEIWKNITSYEHSYQISNTGEIWN